MEIPSTTTRVEEQTDDRINEEIYQRSQHHVAVYAAAGPAAIECRLKELDQEWDIERVLEANAASISLLGIGLGALYHRRWFLLPAAVAGFLLQHAIQGWCPPVPVFRRLGIRTPDEIQQERHALKALRGDYRDIPEVPKTKKDTNMPHISQAFQAAGRNAHRPE
ncbi:hypothetical protein [uncultured Nitrospira sp.]|uniref:hypothetical protein n=1 Tax=uncultured Nitrospira sp. TaxID=157176 RepID=UPI0031402486